MTSTLRLFLLACSLLLAACQTTTASFIAPIAPTSKDSSMPAYETEEFTWGLYTSHYYLDAGNTESPTLERQNWMKDAQGNVVMQWYGEGTAWGKGSPPMGGDKRRARLPKTLRVTYYDYQEDRFYQLDAELSLPLLYDLFKQKVVSPDLGLGTVVPRFDNFKIGIAPQGHVVLWLGGRAGADQVELAVFKAKPLRDMTVERYNASKPAFPLKTDRWKKISYETSLRPETVAKLKSGWMPDASYYLKQRVKYPWRYRMSGNARLVELQESQGNQEHFYVGAWMYGMYQNTAAMRGIPVAATLYFNDSQGKRHGLFFNLFSKERVAGEPDLTPIWDAFEAVFPGRKPEDNDYLPGEQDMATVDIHVSDDLKTYTVTLIKGEQHISLPIGRLRAFDLAPFAHAVDQATPKPEVVKLLQNGPDVAQ